MARGLSVYLDLLRLLAALQVAICHLSWTRIGALDRNIFSEGGHEAVIVFFVLSGFVVRHAAEKRDHSFSDFVTSRISRLYSVVIPCLAATVLCDLAGRALAPNLYEDIQAPESVVQVIALILISLTMLNQSSGYVIFSRTKHTGRCVTSSGTTFCSQHSTTSAGQNVGWRSC
jgi:peptidoglycan/LPS O-acetylase OafA/YrhL